MAAASRFQLTFYFAQARGLRLHLDTRLTDILRITVAQQRRFLFFDQPEQMLRGIAPGFQFPILPRHLRLCTQPFQLRIHFQQDIADAQQIIARIIQAQRRLAATLTITRHPRRLLQKHPQLFWFGFDNARNHALLDDRVGARPQPRP